jgi:hypothetical protein
MIARQQTHFVPLFDFLAEVTEDTEQHSTVSTLQKQLRDQEEEAKSLQASTLTITIDNTYDFSGSTNVFKVNITVSLPAIFQSIVLFSLHSTQQDLPERIRLASGSQVLENVGFRDGPYTFKNFSKSFAVLGADDSTLQSRRSSAELRQPWDRADLFI